MLVKCNKGRIIGNFEIVSQSHKSKSGHHYFIVKCICGTIKIIADSLLYKLNSSCGCRLKEYRRKMGEKQILGYGEACCNFVFRQYKKVAKENKRCFELSKDEFIMITQKNCFYCGVEPLNIRKTLETYGGFIYNGIDRKDNNKGYTLDNCVPCCKVCNYAKRDLTVEEFYSWIDRVLETRGAS